MPYVIFVAAPSIEQLYHTRKPSLLSEKNTKKSRRGSDGDSAMVSGSPLNERPVSILVRCPNYEGTILQENLANE